VFGRCQRTFKWIFFIGKPGCGTTTYSYNTNKQLTGISSPGSVSRTYGYDTRGRVNSVAENIAGSNFSTSFTYDSFGRLGTRTHPSGIVETLGYNSYGYQASISAGGSTRYTITGMNAREQLTAASYGSVSPLNASFGFDAYGYPSSATAGTLQDWRYSFNPVTGNLSSRQNFLRGKSESFTYDTTHDRLLTVTGPQNLTMTYNDNGNINTKSDIGTEAFGYGFNAGPYALTGVTSTTSVIPATNQTATYTSFEKVSTLAEGDVYAAAFVYNSENQRAKMGLTQNGSTILTRWYAGSSYMKQTAGSVTIEYTYLGGDAYSAPVVAQTSQGSTSYYYLLRDYLGNITHRVSTANAVVAEYSFDAWGRRRNPTDWGYNLTGQPELFADRGFTGHEWLKYFNLYNMNGRMYDPLVGRFLSADLVIQDPTNAQNYNRYSYCLNNPLKYSDPSGWRMAAADEGRDVDAYFSWMTNVAGSWHYSTVGSGGNGGGGGESSGGGGDPFEAMNTLLATPYGGYWSNRSGTIRYKSDDVAFFAGCLTNEIYNYWGSTAGGSLNSAIFSYSIIKSEQYLTASNEGTVNVNGDQPKFWLSQAGTFALTTSIADGPFIIGEAIGATALTIAVIHDVIVKFNQGNSHYPGEWTTDRGLQRNPELNNFDPNNDFYNPGNTPPKWFWPSVGAAITKELYENWPQPEPLKIDKTITPSPTIKQAPSRY
jgi:RHS repeat-associated protein